MILRRPLTRSIASDVLSSSSCVQDKDISPRTSSTSNKRDFGVILKKGREFPIATMRHPWIFSGAVDRMEVPSNGCVVPVFDSARKQCIGHGMFNASCKSLVGRMLSFDGACQASADDIVFQNIQKACDFRSTLKLEDFGTNCYRIVNSEADDLSSLVVDRYGDHLVVQSGSLGMDAFIDSGVVQRSLLSHPLLKGSVKQIYEKSTAGSRDQEGILPRSRWLLRDPSTASGPEDGAAETIVTESGIQMIVPLTAGQKTGMFLDQRNMRRFVREHARGKRVLNLCAYTGGFTLYALQGGASSVVSVDASELSLSVLKRNVQLGMQTGALPTDAESRSVAVQDDLWKFLGRETGRYDVIILDPPKLASKPSDVHRALKAYGEANRLAMRLAADSGCLFVSCSCSYFVSPLDFERTVVSAALAVRKQARLVQNHRHAEDHATSLFHPEGRYLKSISIFLTSSAS
ncbi:mitochondrial 23S rRNA m5C1962 methyltransferase RlmI [Andalucia godoyi]|uniref:Mitochondrial 23S rRNA m5C1962 methyltransferase RlmI n=1 Tax=Andalucia godoyi TaxID=505711 RepID=A0A8K0F2N9_ANDGO|nr:mitochondrial 23S rRNA m5C1962 methyltransferase RlmI [Andalucia godoyi]|eukprot:ANDGO_00504.mRNA.1 mitochondrial 23S rRNA m5C1962 methyltransferase RlmI